ncbi:hypothetical protein SLA2020_348120 [Shorea laevis]
MDVGQPMVQLMRPSGSVLQPPEGSNIRLDPHTLLGLPVNIPSYSGGIHSTLDSAIQPEACTTTLLLIESAKTPSRGWKKQARAVSQTVVSLQHEDNQEKLRGKLPW